MANISNRLRSCCSNTPANKVLTACSPKSAERYATRMRVWSYRSCCHIGLLRAANLVLLSTLAARSCTSGDDEMANNENGWLTIPFSTDEIRCAHSVSKFLQSQKCILA